MIIKELIEQLKKFDENLTVIYTTTEDSYAPSPSEQEYDFNTTYYTGREFVTIPKNTKFVQI